MGWDVGVPTSAGLGEVQGEGEEEEEACESVPTGERDSVGLTEAHVVKEKEGEEEMEGDGVGLPVPPSGGVEGERDGVTELVAVVVRVGVG